MSNRFLLGAELYAPRRYFVPNSFAATLAATQPRSVTGAVKFSLRPDLLTVHGRSL
jgi:hypothetical protein